MLDIKFILSNEAKVRDSIKNKNVDLNLDDLIKLYEQIKSKRQIIEDLRAKSNRHSKRIQECNPSEREILVEEGKMLKKDISNAEKRLRSIHKSFEELMLKVPNLYAADVPIGKDDTQNVVIKKYLEPTKFDFKPLNHIEIGQKLGILDFDLGTKVAGRKFYFWKGKGVILDLALTRFAIDIAQRNGYLPLITPDIAKDAIILGSGFTPRGPETQIYSIEGMDISLIGTAEIAVGGMLSDTLLDHTDLPNKYVAFSHCFRTEAGSHGRESRGLYRVHQFGKVELYQFVEPKDSENALEEILSLEEDIYQQLQLPYQIVNTCTGDLGAPAFKKYDIEAWMPCKGDEGGYGEITSVSNCTDFQSRRLKIRYKNPNTKKNEFVHTLNGTAIALSRASLVLLENFQTENGKVIIPEALRPYTGFDMI